jgi:quercetin dioxygenase-like cupin family protein
MAVITAHLDELELHEGWLEHDPSVRARFAFPMFWATGNASTTVLYVELEPGMAGPRHTDTPEEILLVVAGQVEVRVGDEEAVVGPGGLVLVPSMVPHQFRNVGDDTARIVGFFSASVVIAEFEEPVQPMNSRVLGSPTPEMVHG